MHRLFNALGFQASWWVCVAGVAYGLELPAIAFCFSLACVHLYRTENLLRELKLAAGVLLTGIALDSSLQYFSVIRFHGSSLGPLSPFWLWMLWVMFSMTLNSSLSFLRSQPLLLSSIAGMLFGPLSYYTGAALGAAEFKSSAVHILAMATAWLIAFPFIVSLNNALNRRT